MFIPNATCHIRRKLTTFDKFGEPAFAAKTPIRFGLCRYDTKTENSSVRSDASATRGFIDEVHASGRILVPARSKPMWGDILIIYGKTYNAKQIEPRYNVLGVLDHYQIDLEKTDDRFGDEV